MNILERETLKLKEGHICNNKLVTTPKSLWSLSVLLMEGVGRRSRNIS